MTTSNPPLSGVTVIEFAGLAPAPLCGMILADFGATVIRVDSVKSGLEQFDTLTRKKLSICVNLKELDGVNLAKHLISKADVVLDPYRPGVLEKLGLGPNVCQKLNERLIFARLTGYPRHDSVYGQMAGHDINYLALSGILSKLRSEDAAPSPPYNLLADFAGGSFVLVIGILLALFERQRSGKGQVIDANMVSGVQYLATSLFQTSANPLLDVLNGQQAPFYRTYKTKDGKYISVGALEPQFYQTMISILQSCSENKDALNVLTNTPQFSSPKWMQMSQSLQDIFMQKTRNEWVDCFSGTDACVAPVLAMDEIKPENVIAPDLSRTPGSSEGPAVPLLKGKDSVRVLKMFGVSDGNIMECLQRGIVIQANESKVKAKL
ncbi:CoA-transferase family III domain-containing protein [Paraphysoderma sedebokerense]|nr:CoA-transferase family III domain-containing protein [Paraphysoderma sedebokerense]